MCVQKSLIIFDANFFYASIALISCVKWALENSSLSSDPNDFRGPMTVAEIKFHLGHVYELQNKYLEAKKLYEDGEC